MRGRDLRTAADVARTSATPTTELRRTRRRCPIAASPLPIRRHRYFEAPAEEIPPAGNRCSDRPTRRWTPTGGRDFGAWTADRSGGWRTSASPGFRVRRGAAGDRAPATRAETRTGLPRRHAAHATPTIPPSRGGISVVIRQRYRALASRPASPRRPPHARSSALRSSAGTRTGHEHRRSPVRDPRSGRRRCARQVAGGRGGPVRDDRISGVRPQPARVAR